MGSFGKVCRPLSLFLPGRPWPVRPLCSSAGPSTQAPFAGSTTAVTKCAAGPGQVRQVNSVPLNSRPNLFHPNFPSSRLLHVVHHHITGSTSNCTFSPRDPASLPLFVPSLL